MRKLILMMSVSLDGYFEDRNGSLDWQVVDDDLHSHFNEQLRTMDAFLDGRCTYELMAEFWPTADLDPSSTQPMVEFATIWRDMPKIVYSTTLDHAEWNATVMHTVDPRGHPSTQVAGGWRPRPGRGEPGPDIPAPCPDR
jgi:dihydrofolate reductase